MSQTEFPSSVSYDPQEFGPGTLSNGHGNLKLIEKDGIKLRRHDHATEGEVHVLKDGKPTSFHFVPSEEVDVLGVYTKGQPDMYVARNGVYVEIGIANEGQPQTSAQYDIDNGGIICGQGTLGGFNAASFPLQLPKSALLSIDSACRELRERRTPLPDTFGFLASFL